MVTDKKIYNCYKHTNFVIREYQSTAAIIDDDGDPEDDIPLARISQLHGNNIDLQEYVSVDNDVPVCEPLTEYNLIDEFKLARIHALEEEPCSWQRQTWRETCNNDQCYRCP